jgi:predicted PurR-regulated permease PerM
MAASTAEETAASPGGVAPSVTREEPRTAGGGLASPDRRLRRSAWWWGRLAAVLLSVFLAYQLVVVFAGFLGAVLNVVLFVVFGAIVALVASPLVDALVRVARLPRTASVLLVLLGGIAVLGLLLYIVAGPVVEEARSLANQVPNLVSRAQSELNRLNGFLRDHNIPVSGFDLGESEKTVTSRLTSLLLSSITGTLTAVVDVVIVIVVAFWLLKDGAELRRGFVALLPVAIRENVEFALDAVAVVIGGYVRAQLVLATIIGTLAGVGCALLGVPYPLVVALAAGVFELIPIVGPFAGGAVAVLLALTVGPGLALATVVLFLGIHVVEGYVLAPRIQARFVQLHPLLALLALFAGIETGGFLGALFAVPAASLVAVFVRTAVGDWRAQRPELFAAGTSDASILRRRERMLGEFRFFRSSPFGWLSRLRWRGFGARRTDRESQR